MSTFPLIDVLIPCADERLDLLIPCLEALGGVPEDMRVTVMPAAAPGVERWLKEHAPLSLWSLPFAERLTFSEINNRAIAATSDSQVLILMNNDVRASAVDLRKLAQPVLDGIAAGAAPKHVYPDGPLRDLVQAAGVYFQVSAQGVQPNVGWRYAHRTDPGVVHNRYVPGLPFSCAALSRQLWDALNGLDENYRNGYEDTDFCLRGLEIGARYLYLADIEVVHLESQTCVENAPNWQADKALGGERPGLLRFREQWNATGRGYLALGVSYV